MGSLMVSTAALLLPFMIALLFEASSVLSQDLRETDAVCKANGCYVVYFQRKTFLDAWRACEEGGGNLATIKHHEDAATVASLFSAVDLRYSRTKVQVWIGLQRQPRHCSATHVLRGFSWTTGDQDTEFTNWLKEDSQGTCSTPRCVAVSYSAQELKDNLKWLDGPCSVHIDGYLCHYAYKDMCPALWREGVGNVLYTTPFNLQSTLLTHAPFGSVATVSCPLGGRVEEKHSVECVVMEDGSAGWSSQSPICSSPTVSYNACDLNNGGCEHFCRMEGAYFFCECDKGFQLGDDGQSCEFLDVCQGAPCEHECVPLSDGYRCACPDGYMLAPDEHRCLDVDECLQSPCERACVNAPGTFECQCPQGYQADEEGACEDVDECMNEPCEHDCENTLGSYICHCDLDFSPVPEDPSRCQDADECQIPGICQHMCVNYEGSYECHCKEGYELMSDFSSCRRIGEGDDESVATPLFLWVTHQPGPEWETVDYDWPVQQSHTDWPLREDPSVDWPTEPPSLVNADVILVTGASLDPDLPTPGGPHDEEDVSIGAGSHVSQSEVVGSDYLTYTTPPPTTGSSSEDDKEETTITFPFVSTSSVSEGAWNWWSGLTTRKPDPTVSATVSKGSTNHKALVPVGERKAGNPYVGITKPPHPASSTQAAASLSPPSKAGKNGDGVTTTWLLVGLLVPVCIILVVMVALGIVYCTRCTVQPRNKNATDCYHWISGAHDKQGAASPSAGVKAHV